MKVVAAAATVVLLGLAVLAVLWDPQTSPSGSGPTNPPATPPAANENASAPGGSGSEQARGTDQAELQEPPVAVAAEVMPANAEEHEEQGRSSVPVRGRVVLPPETPADESVTVVLHASTDAYWGLLLNTGTRRRSPGRSVEARGSAAAR